MKKYLVVALVMITACRKEVIDSVVNSDASEVVAGTEPFMEKIFLQRTAKFGDSAIVQKPLGYNSSTQTYPLLIFFHGTGEAVNDGGLRKLVKLGPPHFISDSIRLGNFITVCPQDDDGYRTPSNVNDVINAAVKKYRVDTKRIYLTGLSAGARNVMNYITEDTNYAKRVAAVVPMSIIYLDYTHISNLKYFAKYNIHCKIFCGDSDAKYYSNNRSYNDTINKYHALQSQFVTYVGAHSGWNALYKPRKKGDDNVYTWLMKFSR